MLIKPAYRSGVKPREIEINVVLLEELSPPTGEKTITWCLLTTHPIDNAEDVKKIAQVYRARWDIEMLFFQLWWLTKSEPFRFPLGSWFRHKVAYKENASSFD